MSATTAAVSGASFFNKFRNKRLNKIREGGEGGGGGAHTHGGGGKSEAVEAEEVAEMAEAPEAETNTVMEDTAPVAFKSSPAKNMKTGDYTQSFEKGYKPYQMKAAGPKYNNSPINKNYGSPAQRGFSNMAAFGTKSNEMQGGVGSAFDYASPAKGWFSKIKDKIKSVGKKALDPLGIFSKKKDPAAAAAVAGAGAGGGVTPHSHNPTDGTVEAPMDPATAAEAGGDKAAQMQEIKEKMKQGGFGGLGRILGGGGGGGAGGGIGGAMGGLFSDIRLKEKIEKIGNSESGIPIYEFNYIGNNNRYSGAMAQDVLEINPDAVSVDVSGYYKVNYNNIDVDMHLIN